MLINGTMNFYRQRPFVKRKADQISKRGLIDLIVVTDRCDSSVPTPEGEAACPIIVSPVITANNIPRIIANAPARLFLRLCIDITVPSANHSLRD